MLLILAAATVVATAEPDWCTNPKAPDMPRNIEDRNACASWGVSLFMDRLESYRDGPLSCDQAAKNLTESGTVDGPPQVGDGYWVQCWSVKAPSIRCHIVKIQGKTITMK